MDKKKQIREALKGLAAQVGPIQSMLGTVVSVDEGEFTCVINDGEIDIHDVRLRPVLNGNEAVTVFPKEGTWVLAVRIEEDEEWMIVAVDEADKIKRVAVTEIFDKVGNCEWKIETGGFTMKKNAETMKKIMDDLLDGIQQLTVNTNVGPSSVPINIATFAAIKVRIDNFFK